MMSLKILIILYLMTTNLALSFKLKNKLNSKTDKLRKKMKGLLGKNKGEELILDINEFEYPGNNETLKEFHREQWLEYYECLKDRYAKTGPEKRIYPVALMALEGTSVELNCEICISPGETNTVESVEWYFNSSANSSVFNEPVELNEHTLESPEDKTLLLYNIQTEQAGRYWCKLGDASAAPYFLHVDNGSEPTQMVRPDEAPQAPHASPPTIVPRYNLKVYSSWTEWTECSACDKVGKKIRYGYCTVSLLDNSTEKFAKKNSKLSSEYRKRETENNLTKTEEDSETILALVENILPVFGNKIPCRSERMPKVLQDIEEIYKRKSEIMIRFCKVKCKQNAIFEVRDKSGNLLESANNSAGIYSMLQGLPEAPPTPTRTTIYEKHGAKTLIKCPGNLNSDVPVNWQIRNKVINGKLIAEQSQGRIYINMKNQLVIKKLRFADGNIYSCWQNGELAGTVRLEVIQELEIKFDHHVFMLGAIAIVSVFLYVFWKAFKGRKRITKH